MLNQPDPADTLWSCMTVSLILAAASTTIEYHAIQYVHSFSKCSLPLIPPPQHFGFTSVPGLRFLFELSHWHETSAENYNPWEASHHSLS